MTYLKFIPLFLTFMASNMVIAEEPKSCLETAMTQTAMNQCAGIGYKEADVELNRVYQKIRKIYEDDKLLLAKLKKSQLAWIKLRDADFELEYPYTDEPNYYGSSFSMCASGFKARVTLQRVEYLKRWLIGKEDGDICGGSQKRQWKLEELLGKEYNKVQQ